MGRENLGSEDSKLNAILQRNQALAVVSSHAQRRYVVLHPGEQGPIVLEGIAADIWKKIDGASSLSQIINSFTQFDRKDITHDFLKFINDLQSRNYLVSVE